MQSIAFESWLPISGWEGLYEVSDAGRVRSLPRHDSIGRRIAGRIMNPQTHVKGYRFVGLSRGGVVTWLRIHRLVLETFVGPCPDGQEGCHNDGDPSNNALSNLRWDTPSRNHADKVLHGTHNSARKTHCPRNHPLVEPNLIKSLVRRGIRSCWACALASADRKSGPGVTQEVADEFFRQIMTGERS